MKVLIENTTNKIIVLVINHKEPFKLLPGNVFCNTFTEDGTLSIFFPLVEKFKDSTPVEIYEDLGGYECHNKDIQIPNQI